VNIAEAQTEAEVQPHGVADDFDRKPIILVFRRSGACVYTATLSHGVGSYKLTTPSPKSAVRAVLMPFADEKLEASMLRTLSQKTSGDSFQIDTSSEQDIAGALTQQFGVIAKKIRQ